MNCKFCGRESWLSAIFRDSDFCTPGHRAKFHQRLGKVMQASEGANLRATKTADPLFLLSPVAAFKSFRPSLQLENTPALLAPGILQLAFDKCGLELKAPSAAELETLTTVTGPDRVSDVRETADHVSTEPFSPVLMMPRPATHDTRMERLTDLIANVRSHAKRNELGRARIAS